MTATAAIPLAICAASLTAGCASGGRLSPNVSQSRTGGQSAGVIPGSWGNVVVLRPGSPVVVKLIDGARIEGAFRTLTPGDLVLTDSAGKDFAVTRAKVEQVVAEGDPDDLMDGALIGAGIGLATAGAILAIVASGEGYLLDSAKWGAPLLLSAVGGVIGAFVDRSRTDDKVVYVSP